MIRTQIQLPDELFDRAKRVCEARDISLAELARRGLEYMLQVYTPETPESGKSTEWSPPEPRRLGWQGLDERQIKEEGQRSAVEFSALEAPRH